MDASMTALMSSSVRQTPYVARITAAPAAAAEVISLSSVERLVRLVVQFSKSQKCSFVFKQDPCITNLGQENGDVFLDLSNDKRL